MGRGHRDVGVGDEALGGDGGWGGVSRVGYSCYGLSKL